MATCFQILSLVVLLLSRSDLEISDTVWMILSWPESCGSEIGVHFEGSWCWLSGGVGDTNVAAVGEELLGCESGVCLDTMARGLCSLHL